MERKNKSSAPKIKDLDAKQRRLALLKQKQCDAVALHIVNTLIESAVEEDVFVQSLKYINQCHYQDIVEERAISKLCGYPVCCNEIPDMPKKRFHISTKLNKVYDISDRKNYCSNFCYKAGIHIKEQMLTSPLWYRDKEEIPNFELLPKTESGVPGIEIDQGLVKVNFNEDTEFTSVSELTENLIDDLPDDIQNKLNIDCEKEEDKSNEVIAKEKNILKETTKMEESTFFSNIYTSNLADILKQNAEYFNDETKTKTNTIDETQNNQHDIKTSKPEPINNDADNNCRVKFDRTLINKKSDDETNQTKSILSKNKNSSNKSKRKRVSFHSENDVKEIEKIDYNSHEKYERKQMQKEAPKKLKNINLLGSVQEKSNIYKYQIARKTNTEPEIKVKTNLEMKQEKIVVNKVETSNDKEKRLNRLKNSSAYKKANRMSKIDVVQNQNESFTNLKTKLQKCSEEWCTIDTFIFLHGEEAVKKIITEDTFTRYMNKKKNIEFDDKNQKKYEEMCKRLNILELVDKKYDESVTGKKLRPLPRFEELREQAETMDLRVQAFYSGCYEVYDDDCDSETESAKDENEPYIEKGSPAVLPLVDNKDLNAIRRKIFLTSLNRSINIICGIMKLTPNSLLSDIKQLIDTFVFTANNIVFKTKEWHLVVVLLLKFLANKDNEIKVALNSNEMNLYINSYIEQYNLNQQNTEDLFDFLDVNKLLNICITKFSMK